MSSLLTVMLFTTACFLIPLSALSQTRTVPGEARAQLAYRAPNSIPENSVQQNSASSVTTQGGSLPGTNNAWNNPGWSNESFDYTNGISPYGNGSRDTWTAEQSGTANAYDYSAEVSIQIARPGGFGRGFDRVYDSYAMSASDVASARNAVTSGSFFSYHGTQSSQVSRNR